MSEYDLVIRSIKDFALIIGILVAFSSLLIHWKTILRPDLKRFEDRRFRAVEDVYSLISDYRFLVLYAAKEAIPADELSNLLKEKMVGFPSAFVPEHIEKKLGAFMSKLGWNLLAPLDRVFENEQDRIEAFKKVKEEIMNAHREVFSETTKWLGCPDKGFPFPESLLGQQDVSGDARKPRA